MIDLATNLTPGSAEKVELLKARYESNMPLFIAGDKCLEHGTPDLQRMEGLIQLAVDRQAPFCSNHATMRATPSRVVVHSLQGDARRR